MRGIFNYVFKYYSLRLYYFIPCLQLAICAVSKPAYNCILLLVSQHIILHQVPIGVEAQMVVSAANSRGSRKYQPRVIQVGSRTSIWVLYKSLGVGHSSLVEIQ